MRELQWNTYPENWMSQGNRAMISYIEGLEDRGWAVECGNINPHPLYGRPEWAPEYDMGYRYYVLKYNIFDRKKDSVAFYKDPFEAQKAFEKARDPLGKHV